MRSSFCDRWIKSFSLLVLIVFAQAMDAQAHFAWILLPEPGSREFAVVFSEGLHPDNPEYLAKLKDVPVILHGIDGQRTTVALQLVEDRLVGQIPADFEAVAAELPVTWGVITRGEQSFLLKYRAIGLFDLAKSERVKFDLTDSAGPLLRFQPQGSSYRIRASVGTSPVADSTIRVLGSEPLELQTTGQGLASWTPAEQGEYGLYTKSSSNQVGEIEGHAYSEVRTYVTVTLRSELADSRTEAGADISFRTCDSKELRSTPPELPFGITSFGAAQVGDAIYVYGGHTGTAHSYWNTSQSNQLLRWDTTNPTGNWEVVAEGSHRLQGLAMVPHGTKLILVGGFFAQNEEGEPHQLFSQTQVVAFDTESNSWDSLPDLPSGRSSHDAIVAGDKLYVVGGWALNGAGSTEWQKTALVLDLNQVAAGWQQLPDPPFERRALALAVFDGKLFAIGGMGRTDGPTRKTAVFDLKTRTWTDGPELLGSQGMVGFGAAAWPINGMLVVTAYDGSVQVYQPGQESWTSIGTTSDARFFHRMLPYDKSQLVLIGGASMDSGKFLRPEVISVERAADVSAK